MHRGGGLSAGWVLAMGVLASCSGEVELTDADLSTSPHALTLPSVFAGQEARGVITVSNLTSHHITVPVSIKEPFSLEVQKLELNAGAAVSLTIIARVDEVRTMKRTLSVGPLSLPMVITTQALPQCPPPPPCGEVHFDFQTMQCLTTPAEGTACNTQCITGGRCISGACRGLHRNCDDGNLCTVDECDDDTGCRHTPVSCTPSANPCESVYCQPSIGCVYSPSTDGALCGLDDCRASFAAICEEGTCTSVERDPRERCTGTWAPLLPPLLAGAEVSWVGDRQSLILTGGRVFNAQQADTWEWKGAGWKRLIPVRGSPVDTNFSQAWDSRRRRLVAFGGAFAPAQTREFDGQTWLIRNPATVPPARKDAAMAYDSERGVVVLFGGHATKNALEVHFSDTWEWDGNDWTIRDPAANPSPRRQHSMAYDPIRKRVVLYGGGINSQLTETWEWDGATWLLRSPPHHPPTVYGVGSDHLTWDPDRKAIVSLGYELWAWDGVDWRRVGGTVPDPSSTARVAYDEARHQLVDVVPGTGRALLFDGGTTAASVSWSTPQVEALVYDSNARRVLGVSASGNVVTLRGEDGGWGSTGNGTLGLAHTNFATAWDGQRARLVLFGGQHGPQLDADTWEFDGTRWAMRASAHRPSARINPMMAFDPSHQQTLLFGGRNDAGVTLGDTWAWDGTDWKAQTMTPSPPPRYLGNLTWDPTHQRLLLIGGSISGSTALLTDVWAWNGAWTQVPVISPLLSIPGKAGAAWDPVRKLLVMLAPKGQGTWEFDGTHWTIRYPTRSPPTRSNTSPVDGMVWDEGRQRMVVVISGETWEYLP